MSSDREAGSTAAARPAAPHGAETRPDRLALKPAVVDDWPEIALVAPAELDVIETWLGNLLDEILTPPGKPTRRAAPELGLADSAASTKRTST